MKTKKHFFFLFLFLLCGYMVIAQDSLNKSISYFLIGGVEFNYFLAMLIFALMGMFVNIISDLTKRKKNSPNSPYKFSFGYWFKDNKIRLAINIPLIPIALLLCNELIGVELTKLSSFMIGFGSDHILELLKRKSIKQ